MTAQARWAASLLDGLVAAGVRDVVLSPGSRSTPFVLAAAARDELRIHPIIDERAAGFFALGIARVRGVPPLLVCTSGSAAGHYLPAVMEASASEVPLLVLSADRPEELHDLGANQTTQQTQLFGAHVRAFVDLGSPHGDARALRGVLRRCSQAVHRALHPRPGPVHLNARARKPLEGTASSIGDAPSIFAPDPSFSSAGVSHVVAALESAERPLLAIGPAPLRARAWRAPIQLIQERTGAVVIADATSQQRFGGAGAPQGALGLRANTIDADFVLQIGAAPIDAGYLRWVEGRRRAVLSSGAMLDPTADATAFVYGDIGMALNAIARGLPSPSRAPWVELSPIETPRSLGPGSIAACVARAVPAESILVLGNSLAARIIDLFADAQRPLQVLHQRGLSGIDGLVAGSAGAAMASGIPVTLLLGDVSFLHDLGGLASLAHVSTDLRIVVVNDNGGRIFAQLPIADALDADTFERLFATAHGRHFEAAAAQYDLGYTRVEDIASLEAALARPGKRILEAVVSPTRGHEELQALEAEARKRWC